MVVTLPDDELLLALLNTTPVDGDAQQDELGTEPAARAWLRRHGGTGTAEEVTSVRRVRDVLQAVVRGVEQPAALEPFLADAALVPSLPSSHVTWRLVAGQELAARAVLAWDAVDQQLPGRLRPCGNHECRRFLLDRSNGNRAQWCSMAVCGNRMKARRHYQRRAAAGASTADA